MATKETAPLSLLKRLLGSRLGGIVERTGFGPWVVAVACALLLGMRQSFTLPSSFGLSPAQVLFLGGGALWLFTRASGQRAPAGLMGLSFFAVFYFVTTLLSYGRLMTEGPSADIVTASGLNLFSDVIVILTFFFLVTVVRTARAVELVLKAIVIAGALSAFYGLVQFATGLDLAAILKPPLLRDFGTVLTGSLLREGFARPQGAAGHPLELSAILTIIAPLAVALTFSVQTRGGRWWPWAIAALMLVSGAMVTLSRSAIVGLAVSLAIIAWKWPVRRFAALLAGIGAVLFGAWVTNSSLLTAFVAVITNSGTDSSLQSRAIGAAYVKAHYEEHLMIGQGPSTYTLRGLPVLDNQYLSRLIEVGVLGTVALIGLFVMAFAAGMRASSTAPAGSSEIPRAIAASIASLAVISLILDIGGFVQIWQLTWVLFGLAGACLRISRDGGWDSPRDDTGAVARGSSQPTDGLRGS